MGGCAHATLGKLMADNFEKGHNLSTSSLRKMIQVSRYSLLGTKNLMEDYSPRLEYVYSDIWVGGHILPLG